MSAPAQLASSEVAEFVGDHRCETQSHTPVNRSCPHGVDQSATPIEISWSSKRNAQRRDLLINLQQVLPEFFGTFNQIIDFVPAEEQAKKLARERYKFLRTQGWQLSTENAA
mgnify:CR=1 FL=1